MNDAPAKIKQQIVDKIKASTNILVTVSKDPSVDDLSAAIGLTTLLNKIGKHTTAIFSGAIPPAITFLEPNKTFENTVDSLHDFIIALDKEKADHLRYKVDGDVVKIFITPYRTTITGDDLEFSQGDFNVELVIALGVENQEHLDMALAAHGQILHDVTVATFSVGNQVSKLGSFDWHEDEASCLCEMITSFSDLLKGDTPILDKQISTALLTGIVAATDRFSNNKTSSAVMTLAAQLMAAGADQQLIAAKLQESHEINSLSQPVSEIVKEPEINNTSSTLPDGALAISHKSEASVNKTPELVINPPEAPIVPNIIKPPVANILPTPEININPIVSTLPIENSLDINTVKPELIVAPETKTELSTLPPDQIMQNNLDNQQNNVVLSHSYLGGAESDQNALIIGSNDVDDTQNINILNNNLKTELEPNVNSLENNTPTLLPQQISDRDTDDARAAINAAFGPQPVAEKPVVNLPLPPPIPDFSTLSPPPLPDFKPIGADFSQPLATPTANDPTQFKIPGQ